MWKYYFNCNGPVIVEAANREEAQQLCEQEFGCHPCEYLGCAPPGLCDGGDGGGFVPDEEFLGNARTVRVAADSVDGDVR